MATKENVPLNQVLRLINFGPLILVSAAYEKERTIAPIAWYMPLSQNPPLIGLAVGQSHLTHFLITKSDEFVINIPEANLLKAVIYCGTSSGRKEDKFAGAGFTPVKGTVVATPLIDECFANIECKVTEKITAGDHTIFMGQAVAAVIREGLLTGHNIIDIQKAKTIHHLGGTHFAILKEEINIL